MRVTHVCHTFSQLSETFIYDYITELERQGLDNSVLALKRKNAWERPFPKVQIVPQPPKWDIRRIWNWLRAKTTKSFDLPSAWPLLRPRLHSALEDIRPDVLHAHFGTTAALVAPVANKLQIPLIATFYGYDISLRAREERWRTLYQDLWEGVHLVTVLSKEMRERALNLGCPSSKIVVVHLSRQLSAFEYRPPTKDISKLVSVGRLVQKKGHLDLLKAVRRVSESGRRVSLRIVGGGSERKALSKYIGAHALQNCVKLVGPLPSMEVAKELQAADAFILCSKTAPNGDKEGTPTVLVEAQAVGLPCISTFHAGIPEMIPKENHWLLAEAGDVEEIASRIERLLSCSAEEVARVSEAGRAHVEQHFNLTREVKKLRELYRNVQYESS